MKTDAGPCCHVFVRDDRHYAYDASTNNVYEIDPVLADLLRIDGTGPPEDLIAGLSAIHDPEAVRRARTELEAARADGCFRPVAPRPVRDGKSCVDPGAYASKLGHLCLTVTEDCNLRCRYCLHGSSLDWIRPHAPRRMTPNIARRALGEFVNRSRDVSRPVVTFYGGEPLLEFDLIRDLVGWARYRMNWRHLRFAISTNGTLMSGAVIEFVRSQGIRLQISLDGPAHLHDLHRRTREGEETHARIENGVRRLLAHDPSAVDRIAFAATLAPPYDFEAVADYFNRFPPYRDTGIDRRPEVRLSAVSRMGLDLGDDDVLERQFETGLARARARYVDACVTGRRDALGPALRSYFDPPLVKFHHRRRGPVEGDFIPAGACAPGLRKLHVTVDGRYQPCETVGERMTIGHVYGGLDLEAITRLHDAFLGALNGRCADCWAHRLCTLCFQAIGPQGCDSGAKPDPAPESLCETVRSEAEAMLCLYVQLLRERGGRLDFLENSMVS